MSRRWKVAVILAWLVVLIGGFLFAAELLANRFTLVNDGKQTIEWVEIEVCGQTTRFEHLPPGATASAEFQAEFDDSFTVRGEFADGTAIDGQDGYVTNGLFSERVSIRVSPGGQATTESLSGRSS